MTALTQVDVLAEQISASIMTGEYPIGTWLRQESLAERYGVSRQPVREALRQVQASGLVEVIAHRGALVSGPSPRDIREAYMVRGELEGLAAEIATERLTLDDLETMRAAEHTFREASERVTAGPAAAEHDFGWANANDQFHEAILHAANVHILTESIHGLHRVVPRNLTWSAIRSPRLLAENVDQHARIRAAMEVGDAGLARAAMRAHIRRSGELIAEWFELRLESEGQSQEPG